MEKFNFIVPAELSKGEDGSWKIKGLASTEAIDQQGETIIQKGIDLSPIDQKKGIINFDHQKGPENVIGLLDGYTRNEKGLYIEGRLFKNHTKAKAVREIMESLSENDRGRVGLSVEGQILERDPLDPRIIKKCKISAVAVTLNPVNSSTYADLVKSMSAGEIEFDSNNGAETFTADQVWAIVSKALGVGSGYTEAPGDLKGGDALATSNMSAQADEKDKKKKKLKKMDKCMYKSTMSEVLDQLQKLYPENNRNDLWGALKERLETKFPDINKQYPKN